MYAQVLNLVHNRTFTSIVAKIEIPQIMKVMNILKCCVLILKSIHKIIVFFLFDLILYVPVNNFSIMLGQVFLG